jgi:hypothetical protein
LGYVLADLSTHPLEHYCRRIVEASEVLRPPELVFRGEFVGVAGIKASMGKKRITKRGANCNIEYQ